MDLVTDLFASSWAPGLITTFARTYQQHVAVAILGAGFLFYAIANRTKFFAIPRGRRPLDTPHDTARLAELIAHHGLIAKPEIPDRHIQTVFACAGCGFTGRSRISHGRHIAELHVLGQAAGPTCRRAAGQARMSQPHADEMLLAIWLDGQAPDYLLARNQKIAKVTLADVKRVAGEVLIAERVVVTIVGKPKLGP